MSKEACLWIYHEHTKKEIECHDHYDILICDRSPIDSFIYSLAQDCFDLNDPVMLFGKRSAEYWMDSYEKIIYVRPNHKDIVPDGFRSTDREFQKRVEDQFDIWLESNYLKENILSITTEDVINNRFWELYK